MSLEATDRTLEGRAVRGISSSVMGMTIFIASEAIFFGAFFGIYWSTFAAQSVWPPKDIPLPGLVVPSIGVALLVLSGLFMIGAQRTLKNSSYPRGTVVWVAATLVAALAFVVALIAGYQGLAFGIKDGIYPSLFYLMTAIELAHVIGGVVLLLLLVVRASSGELGLRRESAQASALYWYFVVLLGVGIYVVFYPAVTL